jgi:hypothetical protein
MSSKTPRNPADGAEQEDLSVQAAQQRAGTGFWTPQHASDEPDTGFDATYLDWRRSHGEHLDDDYRRWRQETGQPFSEAFLAWSEAERNSR